MRSATADAIVIEELRKSFGKTSAVDGISLRVPRGTIYGLLGPNGAGKTTTIRILATLFCAPTSAASGIDGQ